MAGTLKLTDIAHSSGAGTITVDSLATLAISTGKLTVGGIAIETGAHTTAVSAVNPLTITSGNITGKSNYTVSYNASSGTSTAFVVNLPAPTDFATTVISVVSSTAHGLGNSIIIKDSAGTEVYTLYHKGDYCTFVSDGTNTIRTGNEWVTVTGRAFIDTDGYPVLAAYTVTRCFSTYVTTDFNVGSWWDDVTNYRITAGFDCDLEIHAQYTGYSNNGMMPVLKHLDSSAGLKQWYNYPRVSTEGGYYQGAIENTFVVRNMSATDYLEFYNSNNHSSSQYFTGDTDGTGACFDFRVLRRH